jgi:hypothetical protein
MPTPGPPLRVREGMIRRGRVAPPAFEVEGALEPGWEEGTGVNGDELVVGLAPAEVAFAFAGADIATATLAGSVVDADARRGIQRGDGGLGKLRWSSSSAAVSGSALPFPVMVLAVRLGCERWRALPPPQRYLMICRKTIIIMYEFKYSPLHHPQYHDSPHSIVHPNHPQPHCHIRESRTGCMRNAVASCLNLIQTVPRIVD